MAKHRPLTSQGPHAIGPGTRYRRGVISPGDGEGIITQLITSGITNTAGLSRATTGFPGHFPADVRLPLRHVDAILLGGGEALSVARYRQGSANLVTVFSSSAFGSTIPWYESPDNPARINKEYQPETGNELTKARQLPVVRWAIERTDSTFTDKPQGDHLLDFVNTINGTAYSVGPFTFAAGFLRFMGADITHRKHGGIDQWTTTYQFLYQSGRPQKNKPAIGWAESYVPKPTGDATPIPRRRDAVPAANWTF